MRRAHRTASPKRPRSKVRRRNDSDEYFPSYPDPCTAHYRHNRILWRRPVRPACDDPLRTNYWQREPPPGSRIWDLYIDMSSPNDIKTIGNMHNGHRYPMRSYRNLYIPLPFALSGDSTVSDVCGNRTKLLPAFPEPLADLDGLTPAADALFNASANLADTVDSAVAQARYVDWLSGDPMDTLVAFAATDLAGHLLDATRHRSGTGRWSRPRAASPTPGEETCGDNDCFTRFAIAESNKLAAEAHSRLCAALQQAELASSSLRDVHLSRAAEARPFPDDNEKAAPDDTRSLARELERNRFPDGRLFSTAVTAISAHLTSCLNEVDWALAAVNRARALQPLGSINTSPDSALARERIIYLEQAVTMDMRIAAVQEQDHRHEQLRQPAPAPSCPTTASAPTEAPSAAAQDHGSSGKPLPPPGQPQPRVLVPGTVVVVPTSGADAPVPLRRRQGCEGGRERPPDRHRNMDLQHDAIVPAAAPRPTDARPTARNVQHQRNAPTTCPAQNCHLPHAVPPLITIQYVSPEGLVTHVPITDGNKHLVRDVLLCNDPESRSSVIIGPLNDGIKIGPASEEEDSGSDSPEPRQRHQSEPREQLRMWGPDGAEA